MAPPHLTTQAAVPSPFRFICKACGMAALSIKNVSKRFGSLVALNRVSFDVKPGEIIALLGENGAGKTTLMNILFGHYVADHGSIEIDGKPLPAGSTDAAIRAGVGMVHQHFTLAANMTVLDNIMLGSQSLTSLRLETGKAREKLNTLAARYNLDVNPAARISSLSVGERQRVEILKVLYRGAKILILDEPTAVLTPDEATALFANLKAMAATGMSIIFISHKLHEIMAVSSRVVVLRRGEIVGEIATGRASRAKLGEMMVGRKVTRPKAKQLKHGKPVISLKGLSLYDENTSKLVLDTIDLVIHERQIVALAGVAGNGQRGLAELLSGLRRPVKGELQFNGRTVSRFSPRVFLDMGFGRIPDDRQHTGTIGEMTVWENLISERSGSAPLWRHGWIINFAACRTFAARLIKQFDIRCKSMDTPVRLMSGGNMQKLILARTLTAAPEFILANQPSRGLDEGAIAFVHEQLLKAKGDGAGILLITEDLDEVFAIADQVAVIYHGQVSPPLDVRKTTIQTIGAMMGGDMKVVA